MTDTRSSRDIARELGRSHPTVHEVLVDDQSDCITFSITLVSFQMIVAYIRLACKLQGACGLSLGTLRRWTVTFMPHIKHLRKYAI